MFYFKLVYKICYTSSIYFLVFFYHCNLYIFTYLTYILLIFNNCTNNNDDNILGLLFRQIFGLNLNCLLNKWLKFYFPNILILGFLTLWLMALADFNYVWNTQLDASSLYMIHCLCIWHNTSDSTTHAFTVISSLCNPGKHNFS